MLGDTPAVAKVGGFKEGVGFADKKCRHCMATNEQIQSKVFACCLNVNNTLKFKCMLSIQSLQKSSLQ